MSLPEPLKIGDRILASGPPGDVIGEVLSVIAPDEVPQIDGAPQVEQVKAILHEWHVDALFLIGHKHDGQDVCFFALRHPCGWRDLRGQEIQITKLQGTG